MRLGNLGPAHLHPAARPDAPPSLSSSPYRLRPPATFLAAAATVDNVARRSCRAQARCGHRRPCVSDHPSSLRGREPAEQRVSPRWWTAMSLADLGQLQQQLAAAAEDLRRRRRALAQHARRGASGAKSRADALAAAVALHRAAPGERGEARVRRATFHRGASVRSVLRAGNRRRAIARRVHPVAR